MTPTSDRELIAAASQGQVAAFANLIARHRDVRTRFAMRMLGDYEAADEALQTAFVRAFQTIGRYKEPEPFDEWLFRIVVNECRARALRSAVRAQRKTGEVDAIADWRAAVEGSENGADVQRALDQIDPINREAFILQYIEELSYPEIAKLTGASVVTLERQVDRAVSRLRELLPDWRNEKPGVVPGLPAAVDHVGPSFPARVAMPLRRLEVLNESFEDRLMTKLLRAREDDGTISQASQLKTAPIPAMNSEPQRPSPSPVLPPSPATLPEPKLFAGGFSLPRLTRLAPAGIALGASLLAFGAGYAIRGRRDGRRVAAGTAKSKAAAPKVVRRSDTVRVVRSDTVVVARFAFADPGAKSVALVGDFNRWDPAATPLAKSSSGIWTRTLRITAGRYEYAYLVDGKRWVTDGSARTSHDAFDVESSVLSATGAAPSTIDASSPSTRLKKLLPKRSADRVLAAIASAKSRGLPATALENRALKFAMRNVPPSDIEDAIVADAEAMGKADQLLAAAGRHEPTPTEIDAAAQLLGEGADSASIGALAKSATSSRSLETPLRVSAELVATTEKPADALTRVEERLRKGATDAQLEQLLDNAPRRVAAKPKASSAANVHQAGTPSKSTPAKVAKKKSSGK
jgi:RNA polymerase sigma-70 factor, ECF subfamily